MGVFSILWIHFGFHFLNENSGSLFLFNYNAKSLCLCLQRSYYGPAYMFSLRKINNYFNVARLPSK